MRTAFTIFSLLVFVAVNMAQDNCGAAQVIVPGTYSVDAVNGTAPTLICTPDNTPGTHGEWYRFDPSVDGSITVTTDLPANAGQDTRLHIYSGQCALIGCVGGDDDSGSGTLSTVSVNVGVGSAYYIVFDDRWEANGFAFQLSTGPTMESPIGFNTLSVPTAGNTFAAVDMNDDQLDDIVSTSPTNINIQYQLPNGSFQATNISTPVVANNAIWSLAAGDLDGNGRNDLLYAGSGGVSFLMASADGSTFTEQFGSEFVLCQRSNMVDINADGLLDAFVCHDVDPNVYYINQGGGVLEFNQGGLGDWINGGNYGSIWTDYDNDGDVDLFLSKCNGGPPSPGNIDQMHRNNGDGTFTEVAFELGLADTIQDWSSACGDFDNDGDMDLLVGSYSYSDPGHLLMRNEGGVSFTNVTAGSGYDTFHNIGSEHVTHDFNNDGLLDIKGAGNVIMMNTGDMTFTPVPINASSGPVGDLNNDGFLDIVNSTFVRLNVGNDNNWIRINPVGTVSNGNGIGARIEVTSPLGTQIREIRSGDGFRYMSSLMAHFGLGADNEVYTVTVRWPSGLVNVVSTPQVNAKLTIVEDINTSVTAPSLPSLRLYPNPAHDRLMIGRLQGAANVAAVITDMTGKQLLRSTLAGNILDVSALPNGIYFVEVLTGKSGLRGKFVKE